MKKRDDLFLREIELRAEKISAHLKKLSLERFLKSDLHRSAIVRELEVIGEAANRVSSETQEQFKEIPWKQMIGMRNRLIHGYFDVDYSIVWEVAKTEIPKLIKPIGKAILLTSPSIHPWRICPIGFYHVRKYDRNVNVTAEHPAGKAPVDEQCRKNPSRKDQLYPKEILDVFEVASKESKLLGQIAKLNEPEYADDFDTEILVWTKYWNDILSPIEPLNPNVVKALLGSESNFGQDDQDVHISKRNYARGPFQITDVTRAALGNEKGEIHDHYLTLGIKDVKNPVIAAAAAIRWLFQKKELATHYLKHEASWEEAVADYKGYLKKKKSFREQKGMINYYKYMEQMKKAK